MSTDRQKGPSIDGPRVNEQIRVPQVRLINENGDMVGVVSKQEAMKLAERAGLDLVEISPGVEPPVCKILDYGKFKYEAQKKKAEIKKKQRVIEVKEIQLRPVTDNHDFETKLKAGRKFLEHGDKLKVTMRFRGREMDHQELGIALLDRMKMALEDLSKVESAPKLEGKRMIMILGPK